jgi:hypothetical protein
LSALEAARSHSRVPVYDIFVYSFELVLEVLQLHHRELLVVSVHRISVPAALVAKVRVHSIDRPGCLPLLPQLIQVIQLSPAAAP